MFPRERARSRGSFRLFAYTRKSPRRSEARLKHSLCARLQLSAVAEERASPRVKRKRVSVIDHPLLKRNVNILRLIKDDLRHWSQKQNESICQSAFINIPEEPYEDISKFFLPT